MGSRLDQVRAEIARKEAARRARLQASYEQALSRDTGADSAGPEEAVLGAPQATTEPTRPPKPEGFSLGRAATNVDELKGASDPYRRDGPGSLPFTNNPTTDSSGDSAVSPLLTQDEIAYNLLAGHLRDNPTDDPKEVERLRQRFAKEARDKVVRHTAQPSSGFSPLLITDPEVQRERVREGPAFLGTDIRPLGYMADGFDAALSIIQRRRDDQPNPTVMNDALRWAAPFTLALTERGVSEADSGTGEVVKEDRFNKATNMSPYTAIAPWLAGKLTNKYPDVKWGTDEHLKVQQKGVSWTDYYDTPGQIFEEQFQDRLESLLGFDLVGYLYTPADVVWQAGQGLEQAVQAPVAGLGRLGESAMDKASETASKALDAAGLPNFTQSEPAQMSRDLTKALIPDTPPDLLGDPSKFKYGEAQGAKAFLNLAVAAPLAVFEPDAISGSLLMGGGVGKAGFKMVKGWAGKEVLRISDEALEAAAKAFEQTGDFTAAYSALTERARTLGPIVQRMLAARWSINMMSQGANAADMQKAMKAAKDPEFADGLRKDVQKADELNAKLNEAWTELDDLLDELVRQKQVTQRLRDSTKAQIRMGAQERLKKVVRAGPEETKAKVSKAEDSVKARTKASDQLADAKKAESVRLNTRGLALKEAETLEKSLSGRVAKAQARLDNLSKSMTELFQEGDEVLELELALKHAVSAQKKVRARFPDATKPGAKKAIEAAERRVVNARTRWVDAKKAEGKAISKEAGRTAKAGRKVDSLTPSLEDAASKAAAARREYEAAAAAVGPEVAAKYGRFTTERLLREIEDLGEKVRRAGKVDALGLNQLIQEMNFVKAKQAYDAAQTAQKAGLSPAQKKVFRRAESGRRALQAMSQVDESFRKAIRETQNQIREYSKIVQGLGDAPAAFDSRFGILNTFAKVNKETGEVVVTDPGAMIRETQKRYGDVPKPIQDLAKRRGGSVEDYQAAIQAEEAAANKAAEAAAQVYQAGQLISDTNFQRPGTPGGKAAKLPPLERLAVGTHRTLARMGLLDPIAARGVGMVGAQGKDLYRAAYEMHKVGDIQVYRALENFGEGGLEKLLFTTGELIVDGVRLSANSTSTPASRAAAHLATVAAAGREVFMQDTAARAMAAANIAADTAGGSGFAAALQRLYDLSKKPGLTANKLRDWMEISAPAIHGSRTGVASRGARTTLFQARALMAAANGHDIGRVAIQMGWTGPMAPPKGSLDQAIDFITTESGSKYLNTGIGADVTKEAMEESLAFMQRFGVGISDSRTVKPRIPGLGFLFAAARSVGAKNRMDVLAEYAGQKVFVPQSLADAIREIPDSIVKETTQYASPDDVAGAGALESAARTIKMTAVGGNKIPRLRLFGSTQLGDPQQMAMAPGVGPAMAARVAAVAVPHIIPGAGPAIARWLNGPARARPLFVSSLDEQLQAVAQGSDRILELADGPMRGSQLQREAEAAGVVDALPQKDLLQALRDHPTAEKRATEWLKRNIFNPTVQGDAVKYSMRVLEHEQHMKRLALYIELRKKLPRAEAGVAMRDALYDWSLGVAPWEAETIFKMAAFHSYRRGKWNLMYKAVAKDLAGIGKGSVQDMLLPRSAVPMKGVRALQTPGKIIDQENRERELSDKEQWDVKAASVRSEYGSQSALLGIIRPGDWATGHEDRTGRKASVGQLYLIQGSYEDMVMDELLAYDTLYWATAAAASAVGGGSDYQVPAEAPDMLWEVVSRISEATHGDPMYADLFKGMYLDFAGLDDPYDVSESSKKRNGVKVPKAVAGIASTIESISGLDILGMEKDPNGRYIYTLDANALQWVTRLAMLTPQAMDIQREYTATDTPEWADGYGRGALAWLGYHSFFRLELTDPEKAIDIRAGQVSRELQDEAIQARRRAFPELERKR